MQFTLLLETLDDGINVLPYLSITTRLDDGFVKDTVGLVHLHHAVVVDAEAQQGGKPHDKKQVVAPKFAFDKPRLYLAPLVEQHSTKCRLCG